MCPEKTDELYMQCYGDKTCGRDCFGEEIREKEMERR